MKKAYLLPYSCKKWGWVLFGICLVAVLVFGGGLYDMLKIDAPALYTSGTLEDIINSSLDEEENSGFFRIVRNGFGDEIGVILLMASMYMLVFSKEKDEDEYVATLRCNSLLWALKINIILVAVSYLIIYGSAIFELMYVYFILTCLLFRLKFDYELYKFRKELNNE